MKKSIKKTPAIYSAQTTRVRDDMTCLQTRALRLTYGLRPRIVLFFFFLCSTLDGRDRFVIPWRTRVDSCDSVANYIFFFPIPVAFPGDKTAGRVGLKSTVEPFFFVGSKVNSQKRRTLPIEIHTHGAQNVQLKFISLFIYFFKLRGSKFGSHDQTLCRIFDEFQLPKTIFTQILCWESCVYIV